MPSQAVAEARRVCVQSLQSEGEVGRQENGYNWTETSESVGGEIELLARMTLGVCTVFLRNGGMGLTRLASLVLHMDP